MIRALIANHFLTSRWFHKLAACRVAAELGHDILAWRTVPTDASDVGAAAKAVQPVVEQCFFSLSKAPCTSAPDPEAQVSLALTSAISIPHTA